MSVKLFGINPFSESLEQVVECKKGVAVPGMNSVIFGNCRHSMLLMDLFTKFDEEAQRTSSKMVSDFSEQDQYSVSLEIGNGIIDIRPTDDFELMWQTDNILQNLFGPEMIPRIRYLNVSNPHLNEQLRKRGQIWRVTSIPRSIDEIVESISDSHKPIDIDRETEKFWYHSKNNGHNFITYQDFGKLSHFKTDDLRKYLVKIAELTWMTCGVTGKRLRRKNSNGSEEIVFFMTGNGFDYNLLNRDDLVTIGDVEILALYDTIKSKFHDNILDREYLNDNLDNDKWRQSMFSNLVSPPKNLTESDTEFEEEVYLGLAAEFDHKLKFLPGIRILDDGAIIPDPVIQAIRRDPENPAYAGIKDDTALEIIKRFVSRAGIIVEHVNIGKYAWLNQKDDRTSGRRDKYILQAKIRGKTDPEIWQVSMLRWGVHQYLTDGCSLTSPGKIDMTRFREDELDYIQYVESRDIGLREMCLPEFGVSKAQFELWHMHERFNGERMISYGLARRYVNGTATNRIDPEKFKNPEYAKAFLRLEAGEVAIDLAVGRENKAGSKIIDTGNGIIIHDQTTGLPKELRIIEIFGIFYEVDKTDLTKYAREAALPMTRRYSYWYDVEDAAKVYVNALTDALTLLKEKVERNKEAYSLLFAEQQIPGRRMQRGWQMFDENNWSPSSFGYKWVKAMKRVLATDPVKIGMATCHHLGIDPLQVYSGMQLKTER